MIRRDHGNGMYKKLNLVVLLLALSLFGCNSEQGSVNRPPEEVVRERAQAWADALLAKDLSSAYAFTSPVYRQFATVGQYHSRVAGAANWLSALVETVQCREEVCDVRLRVEYEIKARQLRNSRPMDYKWIRNDAQWWLYVPPK